MKAVIVTSAGGPEKLELGEWQTPEPQAKEILIRVKATALNRADILQREGKYPPPKGASPILGLEVSGEVASVGTAVSRWKPGDKVFGLLPGGGYAAYAVMHEDMAMPMPDSLSFTEAAAIPEVFLTAFQALCWLAHLQPGESLLIHAGASGVGTAAIQLAVHLQAEPVMVTASAGKHALCRQLGARHTIDYRNQDFQQEVKQLTDGQGVDVILDFMAAPYFEKNINSLQTDGRMVMLAMMGGTKVENFNLASLIQKRLQITGTTLRARSLAYQIRLTQAFAAFTLPKFQERSLKAVVDRVFDWQQVQEAHHYMESNQNAGKIVLTIQ